MPYSNPSHLLNAVTTSYLLLWIEKKHEAGLIALIRGIVPATVSNLADRKYP